MEKTVYMLCGVPGSGKTTWVRSSPVKGFSISSDFVIDTVAFYYGLTYDECFKDLIGFAESQMYRDLHTLIKRGDSIVWDQTNLTPKSRAKKLNQIPSDYKVVGVNFVTPPMDVLKERLASRPGKTIPDHVISAMIQNYQPATLDEGFHQIIEVNSVPA
jgi:predicted kinase